MTPLARGGEDRFENLQLLHVACNLEKADMTAAAWFDQKRRVFTTDGHKAYLDAVEGAFGLDVDYAQLIKIYGAAAPGPARYSPADCTGIAKHRVTGSPAKAHVSTSYVERQNLTMRMSMRRFTRLTNALSKKAENHVHALALYFTFYNFVRMHKTLRASPAMAAGISDQLWSMEDVVALIDAAEVPAKARGSYKPRALKDV